MSKIELSIRQAIISLICIGFILGLLIGLSVGMYYKQSSIIDTIENDKIFRIGKNIYIVEASDYNFKNNTVFNITLNKYSDKYTYEDFLKYTTMTDN